MAKNRKLLTWAGVLLKSTKLLKVLKIFKFAKPMITVLSVFISVGLYSVVYNPMIGVGLVALLFVHEMGHIMALNKKGFKTSGPVFIPFLGAAIFAPTNMSREEEAYVGIAGPIVGSLGALLCLGAYFIWDQQWMLLLGYFGLFINLFNMVPISPLDGGRVTQAVGKYFYGIGLFLMIVVSMLIRQPGILLIWMIIISEMTFFSWRVRFYMTLFPWLAMLAAVLLHIGIITSGDKIALWIDIAVGVLILALAYISMRHNLPPGTENRAELTNKLKIKWFMVWVSTTIILVSLMAVLSPEISKMSKKSKNDKDTIQTNRSSGVQDKSPSKTP